MSRSASPNKSELKDRNKNDEKRAMIKRRGKMLMIKDARHSSSNSPSKMQEIADRLNCAKTTVPLAWDAHLRKWKDPS